MAILTRIGAVALALFAIGPVAATAQGVQKVGEVVQAVPTVKGLPRCGPSAASDELVKKSEVCVGMEVATSSGAGARILINPEPARKGVVILGPKTEVKLTERSLTAAGSLQKMSWLVKLGQFRLALLPRDVNTQPGEGESFIYTAAGDLIQLTGTDVAVKVAEDGTLTVWVIEGEVVVKAASGGTVRVPGRHRTRVRPGREPEPPRPFDPSDGSGGGLSPYPGPPFPEDPFFPDPPHPDLQPLRLDLPQ